MATVATQLNSGTGFSSGETVTASKLNNLVNTATVTGIVNADIDAAAAIAGSKLADGGVATAKIADAAVSAAKLAADAVETAKIKDANVTAAKLASASVTAAKLDGGQTGSAPIYGCRAWVNFQGDVADNLAGTYVRSGTDVTVTALGHGLIVGNVVRLDFTGGSPTSAADGTYTVTQVDNADNFHVTTSATGTSTGGTVTLLRRRINAEGNVSSVTYLNTAGQYVVNFSVAMLDGNYAVVVGSRNFAEQVVESPAPTAQAFYISTYNGTPTLVNDGFTMCSIFR